MPDRLKSASAPFRPTRFGPLATEKYVRPDGAIIMRAPHPLEPYPTRLTERLVEWAAGAPERVFLARRDAQGSWRHLTYRQALAAVRALAQALLDRHRPGERTIAILSENSLEHALLALAAAHVGIPYAPISPPYSLVSQDLSKLRHTLQLMTPDLIFAADGARYERALRFAHRLFPDATLVVADNPPADLPSISFASLLATPATPAVEAAFAQVGPDTVVKVLFSSGSTDLPKGVINTQRMWCANLQQITQTFPFLQDAPPLFVDWLPWNHTFGGNHNFGLILYNGGSLYIDDGRPTASGIATTIANLRELAPTAYFNVPRGFEELVLYLRREPELRRTFFSRLQMLFYAGAALPQHVWDNLDELAAETTGYRVPIISGLGMTESGPSALFAHWPGSYAGLLGVPVAGMTLKLARVEDKLEARYHGPNVTPGYWRNPGLNAASFDEEGFFRSGDAVKFVSETDPTRGLLFDGRISEDFKLTSGTWVHVGALRAQLVRLGMPLVQDAAITGHNRDYVGAILFLNPEACRALSGLPASAGPDELYRHPDVCRRLQALLDALAERATGSSNRIVRAIVAVVPPSIDVGEITDKGSLNQRAILGHRADLVEALYAPERASGVFQSAGKDAGSADPALIDLPSRSSGGPG